MKGSGGGVSPVWLLCVCVGYCVMLGCRVFHFISASLPRPVNASSDSAPIRAPLRITWKQLYRQFGAHPAKASHHRTVQNFRSEVLRELKKIKIAWPDLNYSTAPGVLILHPSTPTIPPSDHR